MSRWQFQQRATPPFQPTPPLFPVINDNSSEVVFTRAFQYDVTVNPGVPIVPSFGYFRPFQDPVRPKPNIGLTLNQVPLFPLENVTVDKWYIPFADVIRPKPYKFTLPDAEYLAGGFLPNFQVFTDFPEVTFTRQFQYQASAFSFGATQEVVTLDKWYQNFVPLPNLAFEVSESVVDFVIQLPETITVDKWFEPLSIPQKLSKSLLGTALQQSLSFVELIPPVTSDWFYHALSEPVRLKPGLRASLQNWQETLVYNPVIDTFQDLRWFSALSEPVRYRWFPSAEQQALGALTIPFLPSVGYADVIVQTWNVLVDTDTWIINLDLTGCDCDG